MALELGKTLTGELAGGQSRQYTITAGSGQFLRVVVSRPGFATIMRLRGPVGQATLVELHWPETSSQRQSLRWIAKPAGRYRVELTADIQSAATEPYENKLEALRAPLADDRRQIDLQEQFEQARTRRHEQSNSILN